MFFSNCSSKQCYCISNRSNFAFRYRLRSGFRPRFFRFGPPPANFFYDSTTFSNAVAVGIWMPIQPWLIMLLLKSLKVAILTNQPGRIQIYADNLDLTKTRMDDEGSQITIVAANLTNSAGAEISCQNLSFNLGSTNGFLNITNLALSYVSRLHGTIDEWSGLWTNVMYVVITNNFAPVVNGSITNWDPSPLTNSVQMDLAITVVDASGLVSTVPVRAQDLILNSTNIVVSDKMTVDQTLQLNGQSFTLLGGILLRAPCWIGLTPMPRHFVILPTMARLPFPTKHISETMDRRITSNLSIMERYLPAVRRLTALISSKMQEASLHPEDSI